MNKKVLTLCAGVLLVGGSAIFTVNAMNAGNEKAQTAYVVKANAEGVAGYELSVVKEASYTWSLVKIDGTTNEYYLSPIKGYFLASDGSIKSVATSKPEKVSIMAENDANTPLAISFAADGKSFWKGEDGKNEEPLYLWLQAEDKTVSKYNYKSLQEGDAYVEEVNNLAFATSETVFKDFAEGTNSEDPNGTQVAYIDSESQVAVGTFNSKSYNDATIWIFDKKDASLSVKSNEKQYWLCNNLTLHSEGYLEDGNGKAKFEYKDSKLYLVALEGTTKTEKQVYLVSGEEVKFTTEAETEGAEPVVLYEATKTGEGEDAKWTSIDETVTESATDGNFVLAQGITEDVIGKIAYSTTSIASTEQGAAGAEYGHIDGIQFIPGGEWNGGLLRIVDVVPTAKVPVCIYYKVGKDDNATIYYLTTGGKWVKDAKTTWILVDGVLTTLDGKNPIEGVNYTPDGITGVDDYSGHDVIFELAQESLPATELNSCDYPLLSASEMDYNDYVILGGYSAGVPVVIVQGEGEEASLTNANDAMNRSAVLWKVKKEYLNDGRYSYIFTNRETGEDLNIKGYKRFIAYDYNGGVQLLGVDVNGNISSRNELAVVFQAGINVTTSNTAATVIGFYQSNLESYSAGWLMHRYGSSFQLNFTNYDGKNTTWKDNIFEGVDLVPVVKNGNELEEITEDNADWLGRQQYFLLKKRGTNLYAVLDVSKPISNVIEDMVDTGGYRFQWLSEENVKKVLDGNTVDGIEYYPYFRINYLEGETEYTDKTGHDFINNDIIDPKKMDPYCIEVADYTGNWMYDVIIVDINDDVNSDHMNLYVTVNDRCEHDARRAKATFYDDDETIVRGEDKENNPLNYRYVNIKFKAGDQMQFYSDGNYVNLNNKVLGISESGYDAVPTEAEYYLFDKAEGQWAVSMTDFEDADPKTIDSRKFTFTNRENANAKLEVTAMHYMGNNTYAVEYATGGARFGVQTINGNHYWVARDTLVITPAKGNLKLTAGKDAFNNDSYANWTKEDLQDRTFQLSIDAAAQLYVTENEGKDSHFLGLTDDVLDVTNWRLVPFTAARVHDVDAAKYLTAGTDSVYTISHPMGYENNKFVTYNDTTAIVAYALQNIANNEWLRYDPSQSQTILSMICDPNSKNYTTANLNEAYRFVLKEKAEGAQKIESGAYNIIGVDAWELDADKYVKGGADAAYYTLDLSKKLYGATSYQKLGAVEVEGAYEQPTSNDIFTIATTASQEYVKATPMDTVRIYGAEENDFLLYENGQFLNMGNKAGIAPAMVLDTAYYSRTGNNRYQYLIVVNPDYKPEVPCDIEGHPALHPDTMYGRFLVNQIDSAVMVSRNHNNKFINDIEADEKELKLGFQWGYRTGDKLYLTAGKDGKVIETIDLSTPDFNKAKFAFKYVNEAVDKQFKVQTAWYDYDSAVKAGLDNKDAWTWNNEGYLRSVNGVIVVTNGYTHGEEFLMAQENSDPTANESINASSVVVAGVDGAVVVKGAEGKNVIVSTILGKVVANEVVSSDNATIAAPAGIVVVSVDGESFKVVVK